MACILIIWVSLITDAVLIKAVKSFINTVIVIFVTNAELLVILLGRYDSPIIL